MSLWDIGLSERALYALKALSSLRREKLCGIRKQ